MRADPEPGPDAPTFYEADGVIDGVHAALRRGHGLLVQNGRVTAVGPAAAVCPADAGRVAFPGCVLVPGFVDAHTHITIRPEEGGQHEQLQGPPAWQAIRGVGNLRRMLRSGVTTARIMTERHDIDYQFRAAIDRGEAEGPRLLVAGPGLSPPGGHGSAGDGVAGSEALRRAVRERIRKGADHIKIFMTGGVSSTDTALEESNYSAEEIRAVVEEARAEGRYVAAHAHGGPGVDLAVAEGVRSIEHGALLTEANVAAMAAAGTWLVLTNAILFHPEGIERGDASAPAILAKVEQARRSMAGAARMARRAGIAVAVGTDSMHGRFGYELQWMVEHGWTPLEALRAATSGGARLLGLDHEIGTLAPGCRADAVVLPADPLADIGAVTEVVAVIKDGVIAAGQYQREVRGTGE